MSDAGPPDRYPPPASSSGLPRGLIALALAEEWRGAGSRGLLFVSSNEQEGEHLGANLHALFPDCPVLVFPRWDCLPYDSAGPSSEIMGRRASVLRRLAAGLEAPLVIATTEALLQRVPPREVWPGAMLKVVPGETRLGELGDFLQRTRYGLDMLVDEPGEAVMHGQVVDVFPAGALGPVRFDHDGDVVTRIYSYDPGSQRTLAELPDITLDAASEFIGPGPGSDADPAGGPWLSQHYPRLELLFDYMPAADVLLDNPAVPASRWFEQIEEGYQSRNAAPRPNPASGADLPPPPDQLYCSEAEWQGRLRERAARHLQVAHGPDTRVPVFATESNPGRAYRRFVAAQREEGRRIVLAAASERDLKMMLRRLGPTAGQPPRRAAAWRDVVDAPERETVLIAADFDMGFVLPTAGLAVIAAADLLGSRAGHQVPMELARPSVAGAGEAALRIGDAVIHLEHGLGLLRGLENLAPDGAPPQEAIRIEYAKGTNLLVPVQEIGSIWRYGAVADAVSLDRLDGDAWKTKRERIERELADTARQLLRLATEREARDAPKLSPPAAEYERFVAGFPFAATVDQARAVEEILADLGSGHPMDRLVCGDVGFGKTEVALRAAAAAVLSGCQVAVVVPTTVLARQHLGTFRRRFARFAKQVAPLSRLVTPAEARTVKQGLAEGSVDIVIGTHAVAAKGVRFNRLGLLIVDEEQRFGIRTKQKLRGFAAGTHVLTLSATPIPRTLQGALVGLHSLSLLETPPARRLPVQTVVTAFQPGLARQALLTERRRRGQSFVVCPRIEEIDTMAARLAVIVPELDIRIVHGKMPAAAIDEIMVGFADGVGDVLLATNIIESGLDLPRANTILVWRPDRFGAAQLHQLRGRVGRGRRRAFAYLLTDPEAKIASATERRLLLLAEQDRLGAGFAISRHDMDMRGAGDLFGEAQAGHIRLIGIDLYRALLDRAVAEAKDGMTNDGDAVELNLEATGSIPADYVADPEIRIDLYRRLARLRDRGQIEELAEELEDRFGEPPPAVRTLLDLARAREMARGIAATRIDAGPRAIALTFEQTAARRWRKRITEQRGVGLHWTEDRLVYERPTEEGERVSAVLELLGQFDR